METKDIVIDQDLLVEAAKVKKGQSLADAYKWYIHLQYIKYIEGVATYLSGVANCHPEKAMVLLSKKELRVLVKTLSSMRTY